VIKRPCHHGMARPEVVDGGTASSVEGYYEYLVSSRGQPIRVVLQLGGWVRC
jgi:hypothetical protein